MRDVDRRHQMANVSYLESTLLKVGNSLMVEVVTEERSMDQRDSFDVESPEGSSCRRCRHQDRNAM